MLSVKALSKKYLKKSQQEQVGNGIVNPLGFLPFITFEKRMRIYNRLSISALMIVSYAILILLLQFLEG